VLQVIFSIFHFGFLSRFVFAVSVGLYGLSISDEFVMIDNLLHEHESMKRET